MYYAYYRYKTMAMSTHTPTTMAPLFAGYYGYIKNGNKNENRKITVDASLWKLVIDSLQDDVNKFINCVQNVLDEIEKKKKMMIILMKKNLF